MYYTFQASVFIEMNRHLRYKNKHDKMKEIKTKQKLIYQLWTLQSKKKKCPKCRHKRQTLTQTQNKDPKKEC